MTSKLSAMSLPGEDPKDEKGISQLAEACRHGRLINRFPESKAGQDGGDNSRSNVRFAEDKEIDPLDESRRNSKFDNTEELSPEAHEQIRSLAMSLQKSRLQESRMANFAYETVSMPPSRVCMLAIYQSIHSAVQRMFLNT